MPRTAALRAALLDAVSEADFSSFISCAVRALTRSLARIEFMPPPAEIGKSLARMSELLFDQIRAIDRQAHSFATLRDRLRPNHLSGELILNDVERLSREIAHGN